MSFCWEPNRLPYLSRTLDLPPLVAQAAFDATRSARTRPSRPSAWDIVTAAGRLELQGDGLVPPPPRPCYWSYRQVSGRIRSSCWHPPIPCQLELVPWSSARTAVGVRADGIPLLYADERLYVDVGHEVLRTLAADLETWALHELAALGRSLDRLGQSSL